MANVYSKQENVYPLPLQQGLNNRVAEFKPLYVYWCTLKNTKRLCLIQIFKTKNYRI